MPATIQFNPTEIISRLENSDSSGCLEINEGLVSWKIYLQQGQLKYVDCSAQLLDQLKYYLHYLGFKQAVTALKELPASYLKIQSSIQAKSPAQNVYRPIIFWLLAKQHLNSSQGLKLVEQITKDAFQTCLWLRDATHSWQGEESPPLWIRKQLGTFPSLKVSQYLSLEKTRLQQWQNCSDLLLSNHQRPYLSSGWENKEMPANGSLNQHNIKELAKVIRGRTSIRQLSILLQKDELQVAQILSPYIDRQIIFLRDASPPLDQLPSIPRPQKAISPPPPLVPPVEVKQELQKKQNTAVKTWKIICIDDSPTILKEIKRFLDRDKFEVTAIDDPVQAVPTIFRIKPDLILLDITMPKINGYKLCGLLRDSKNCDRIPIIMVTGNTGFIDKARAKIAGATDYFTKPFTQQGLMQIVEKYLQ